MKNNMIDAAINRSRTTMLIMCVILLFGVIARMSIPVEANPRIDVPVFVIVLWHEGISSEDAVRLLAQPMETELRSIEGKEEVDSYGSEGGARVVVYFDVQHDLNEARNDIREAVDRAKARFPSNTEEPIILEQSTSDFSVVNVNLVSEGVSERTLVGFAKELQNELESISDVLEARIQGDREELLEIVLDPAKLDAYQLPADQFIAQFSRNNRLVPAGSLNSGEGQFAVKIPSVIESAEDLFNFPIKVSGDTVLTLADVATVRRTFKDRDSYARINGYPGLSIGIVKRVDANIIRTVEQVREVAEQFRSKLPNTVRMFYSQDQAPYADAQVTELQGNIITALVLIMVLVVGAMGFRSGLLVGLAIPFSFLFALILLWLLGYSYNFMVMFGMLLGLGMLIDGAIVITEYADRKLVEGQTKAEAYANAVKRMFWPVTASVATTLAAFAPMLLWPGVSGKFMSYLPVTVFAVLSGSLLYALFFGPTLGAHIGKPSSRSMRAQRTNEIMETGDLNQLGGATGFYVKVVKFTTKHAVLTIFLTIGVLVASFIGYGQTNLGMIFFNQEESQYANTVVRARGNLNIDEALELVQPVEQEILGIPGVKEVNTWIAAGGQGASFSQSGELTEDTIASLAVSLHEETDREMSGTETFEEIRKRTADLAGVIVETSPMISGPPVGKPVQIQLSSYDLELMDPVIARIREFIDEEVEGLRDVTDTRPVPGIQWEIEVDRAQAALYGADVSLVGMAIQLVTNGVWLGEYRPNDADDAVDIRVRFPEGKRGFQALDDLNIPTQSGLVPISNFVQRLPAQNVNTIQRSNQKMVHYIRANVDPDVLADTKVKEISAWLETQEFDPRVAIDFRGANEEQQESVAFVIQAFSFALCLMFVFLVTQFNSLYQSVVILLAVIMSTAGVLLGLIITNQPFSAILTGVGIVSLAGIVVNNNIVLIDTYNTLHRENPDADVISIIVRTGAQRFRPVILTTVTTVIGLLPLASHLSIDFINNTVIVGGQLSGFWVPLARAIVFGLSFASVLTLLSTPAFLALPYHIRSGATRISNLFRRGRRAPVATAK